MKYRVVTTDYANDGTPIVDHHDAVETFEDARMDAEQLKSRHAVGVRLPLRRRRA